MMRTGLAALALGALLATSAAAAPALSPLERKVAAAARTQRDWSLATLERSVVRELDDWPHVRFPPAFDLSHDGRWFVFGRVDQLQNDVMLVQHFR